MNKDNKPCINLNYRILHELYVNGVSPSVFIREFKARSSNIDKTIVYFKYNKNKIMVLPGMDKDSNRKANQLLSLNQIIEILNKEKAFILNISDRYYPELLKQIYFPPPLIFCKGHKTKNLNNCIAVVGTRQNTVYGRDVAVYLAGQLAKMGITIVSGMASGIDYWAHKTAIKETGGSIGVLGCGINIIYPPENKKLFSEILENGGIMTEFIPCTPPLRKNFPARNRIISGICMGVVVIEAPEKSGAMITAEFALEQNREVFSVPGNIFYKENSGCHTLIKNGAKLVSGVDDVLSEITHFYSCKKICKPEFTGRNDISDNLTPMVGVEKKPAINNNDKNIILKNPDQKIIYGIIGYRPKTVEEIVCISKLDAARVLQIISELALENYITEKSLNQFVRM